jgi:hypothetical protein
VNAVSETRGTIDVRGAGSALTVYIDGIPCGTARFGEHKGRLAIQLQTFGARDAEPQT